MCALKLNEVKLGPIRKGGFIISYTGTIPNGAKLTLCLSNCKNNYQIDMTGRNQKNILGSDNLAAFLACIRMNNLWGKKAKCSLMVSLNKKVIETVESPEFDCPVRPYVGRLNPTDVGVEVTNPNKPKYTGNGKGRMLYMPSIDQCYYFSYDGKFETNNLNRGYDCITYAGAAFGVNPSTEAMSAYGTRLADHLGATQCMLENKTGDEIKEYFTNNPRGTFLMWSDSHVVIIHNSFVHEFSQSRDGYVSTSISNWWFGSKRYWVRKPRKQF